MMEPTRLQELTAGEQDWLDAYLDGTIAPDAFESLQEAMLAKPELRAVMRRYLSIDHALHLASRDAGADSSAVTRSWVGPVGGEAKIRRFAALLPIAAAAGFAFLLGTGLMYLFTKPDAADNDVALDPERQSAAGFAVVGRLFDAEWTDGGSGHREGDMLGAEVFQLASGTAEIQFFSGATMIVEGPAEISLTSAWEASCREGAVRMKVPPAARGFKLQAPSSEIIDLGTEFGLVVRDGKGHVEVFDGEISISHQGEAEQSVKQGAAFTLAPDSPMVSGELGAVAFPDAKRFGARSDDLLRTDFERWESHRDQVAVDERLLAYYTFDQRDEGVLVPNIAMPRDPELDGAVVLAESVAGRWKGMKSALEFRRPGARVRVNIPGEFSALTFACWVRIDSLDRQYNALFMGDGYETGEPHWQIREDGKMMLSVMVDDSRQHPEYPKSRFHQVYFSPSMWDLSMSGQWVHLASVFDPGSRSVSHFVNGERLSRERIEAGFEVATLRIGNAEIGNWGQPFRKDPTFAIRNLNGRMDELAIFQAALDDAEIARLFEHSRSQHR